jgi:uncharacterized membrane protein
MLKNISRSIFISLITPLSAIYIQPVARATTTFCNQTAFPVEVAYARGTFDPRTSIQSTSYQVKGWLKLDPGACTVASTEPADKVNLADGYTLVRHYYHAKSASINPLLKDARSPGTENFCIRDANFQYGTELGDALPKSKCDRGYKQVKFSSFNSDIANYTVLLTTQQSSPQQSQSKSFIQWCQESRSNSIPDAEINKTVSILLSYVKTIDCKQANSKLKNLTSLNLGGKQIRDIQVLASLNHLTSLDLHHNIRMLSKLNKITFLQVSSNPIDYEDCPLKPKSICIWVNK